MSDQNPNALHNGYAFEGYRIERLLGAGGFGITYLAVEVETGRRVALKEYLPKGLAMRVGSNTAVRPIGPSEAEAFDWGLARFADEARTLVKLRHPNIVWTLRFFRAHSTAYLAMDYVDGESLGARLARVGVLTEAELRALLAALIDGLKTVHAAGFLHRDIKPDNIFLRADTGAPVLLDFGAAREALGRSQHSLTAMFSAGYAPYEQYGEAGGDQGAWTDIYALCATAYRCLAGERPPPAPDRVRAMVGRKQDPLRPASLVGAGRYGADLLAAVDAGLAIREADRPQSLAAFEALLRARPAEPIQQKHQEVDDSAHDTDKTLVPDPPQPPGRPPRAMAVTVLVALLLAGVAYAIDLFEPDPAPARLSVGPSPGTAIRDCTECPAMVVVPPGSFIMGSPPDEAGRFDDEGPQRRVIVPRAFAMGAHEITFSEWSACVEEKGCSHRPDEGDSGGGRKPVFHVSWDDANQYAAWLSRKTGQKYRLPSEAEWEYAARAGAVTPYTWGDDIGTGHANCAGCLSRPSPNNTALVGSFPPNRFGLHDMHGNLMEWVSDCWNPSHRDAPTDSRPRLSGDCTTRVVRGGAWNSPPASVRAAWRGSDPRGTRSPFVGFRLVREL